MSLPVLAPTRPDACNWKRSVAIHTSWCIDSTNSEAGFTHNLQAIECLLTLAREFFQRLEETFLGFIRERRWSSGLMSRYLGTRMVQQLQCNLAQGLMCEAVITLPRSQDDLTAQAREEAFQSIHDERAAEYAPNISDD